MTPYDILRGKTAVITGSGRGIGRAIALELASHGANIAVNYFRHRAQAEQTAAEIEAAAAGRSSSRRTSGEIEGVQRLVQAAAEAFGGRGYLRRQRGVGRAEAGRRAGTQGLGLDAQYQRPLHPVRRTGRGPVHGRHGWGRIIGITSFGSRRVLPEYSIVGVSKAAIEALIRYLAVELAPQGIVCNAVSPGVVETEALDFFPSKDAIVEGLRRTPAGRFVTPEEVAKLVAWLCTDDARMIVGQTIVIDGGYELLA